MDIGLSCDSATSPLIQRNTSTGAATLVTLFNATGGQITDNSATTDPSLSGSGIYIGGGDHTTTVSGNHIHGFYYGVALRNDYGDGPSTGTTITGNDLTGNYGGGISATGTAIDAGETVQAHGNDLSNNPTKVKNMTTTGGSIDATSNWSGTVTGFGTLTGVTTAPWCTASDCSTKSTNADLTGLTVSTGTLNPSFNSATTGYTLGVGNGVSSITLSPTATPGASTRVSGGTSLAVGSNTKSVAVTSADGTATRTYTVTVTRASAPSSGRRRDDHHDHSDRHHGDAQRWGDHRHDADERRGHPDHDESAGDNGGDPADPEGHGERRGAADDERHRRSGRACPDHVAGQHLHRAGDGGDRSAAGPLRSDPR